MAKVQFEVQFRQAHNDRGKLEQQPIEVKWFKLGCPREFLHFNFLFKFASSRQFISRLHP